MPFSKDERSHLTCYYCKLHHESVEAGGVYYCPNMLCTGPGAAWFRHKLKSYCEVSDSVTGRHTVDPLEAVEQALTRLRTDNKIDDAVKSQVLRSIVTWLPEVSQ